MPRARCRPTYCSSVVLELWEVPGWLGGSSHRVRVLHNKAALPVTGEAGELLPIDWSLAAGKNAEAMHTLHKQSRQQLARAVHHYERRA